MVADRLPDTTTTPRDPGMERLDMPHLAIISPQTVPILNSISRPRAPVLSRLGDRPLTIQVHSPDHRQPEALTLGLVLGEAPALLRLDDVALQMLSVPLALKRSLKHCSVDISALWLEYALLEWFEPLEQMLDVSIHLSGTPAHPADFPLALPLSLDNGEQRGHLSLSLSSAAAEVLSPGLEQHCPVAPRPCSNVTWPVQWIGGYQHLTLAELRSLQPGDVVMVNRPDQGSAVLVGNDLLAATTEHQNNRKPGLQLGSRLHPPTRGDFHMAKPANGGPEDHSTEAPSRTTDSDNVRLEQLPVHLVCEFGRLELSLKELRELNQGSVLPLSRPPEEAVDLVINGRVMGKGRLVEIGDGLGVQIERLATDE
ncbi:type III secretion system cytoplasmic ring protein SctQ [Halomonas cupida]|uniref:type III secretion system cytoplasmic ring protein SctQ n=1 Tax=Halomonas cupida TaxID=44933 RepID=UPI003A949435